MTISQLKKSIFNGKKPKFVYYAKAYAAMFTPRCLLFPRISSLDKILQKRNDRDYILERVDYYCKDGLADGTDIKAWTENSVELCHQPKTSQKVYYFDAMETARHFPQHMRWKLISGDVDYVPQVPSIVKSRPLCDQQPCCTAEAQQGAAFHFRQRHHAMARQARPGCIPGKSSVQGPKEDIYAPMVRHRARRRWSDRERSNGMGTA